MQRPPHVPVAPQASPAPPAETPTSACDFTLKGGLEPGKRLLANRAAEGRPRHTGDTLVWVPLPTKGRASALVLPAAAGEPGPGVVSGCLAGPLELLGQAMGPLRTLRLLEAGEAADCCGSRLLVELETAELRLIARLHESVPAAGSELRRLRAAYAQREAGDWAMAEWNSRLLDPVDPAGILLVDARLAGGGSPQVYVLWQDVDRVPRAWEAFAELPQPNLLRAALADHFRYVARDAELLVVDRSPINPLGRRAPLSEELVYTAPFARPPLEVHDAQDLP